MPVAYEKVIFTWREPRPAVVVPALLNDRRLAPAEEAIYIDTIQRVLSGSLDRYDRFQRHAMGERKLAERGGSISRAVTG